MSKIIEIEDLGFPKSLIIREGALSSELIDTNKLVEELNEQLRQCNVSGQSEQCVHTVNDLVRLNSSGFKCKCGKEVTYF